MPAFLILLLLALSPTLSFGQLISHQKWQSGIIQNGVLDISCADLRLPYDRKVLLSEPSPTTQRGDMDYTARSAHPVKVKVSPESGVSDVITGITGCTTDGAKVELSTAASGQTITISHNIGQIQIGSDIVLSSTDTILPLQRKNGVWLLDGGVGSGGGGKVFSNLDGIDNAAQFLDSANNGFLIWGESDGGHMQCVLDYGGANDTCDHIISIPPTRSFKLDLVDDETIDLEIASDGTTTLGGLLKEIHTAWVPAGMMIVDGTQCTKNVDVTLNSEVYPSTITCADNDASTIRFDVEPGNAWDTTYLTLTGVWFQNDSTPDGELHVDWSAYCVGDNDPDMTNAYSTETAMDMVVSGYSQNDRIVATTAALTVTGSCAKGDGVHIRGQVDATGTTTAGATSIHLMKVGVNIKVDSWSN